MRWWTWMLPRKLIWEGVAPLRRMEWHSMQKRGLCKNKVVKCPHNGNISWGAIPSLHYYRYIILLVIIVRRNNLQFFNPSNATHLGTNYPLYINLEPCMVGIKFGRYEISVSITFSHKPDEAILFWHDESLSAIHLFSVPEKIEELFLLTIKMTSGGNIWQIWNSDSGVGISPKCCLENGDSMVILPILE